jgi:hypothetical protein
MRKPGGCCWIVRGRGVRTIAASSISLRMLFKEVQSISMSICDTCHKQFKYAPNFGEHMHCAALQGLEEQPLGAARESG